MDTKSYKGIKTTRGLNYHYYHSSASAGKPFLVLLHGFPSTSYDWRHQVAFFKAKGYGLIVPDMLGYGGTAKPTDPAAYKPSLIVKDIIDILDAENIKKAVFIGHDWGSFITARIVQYQPDRVIAFAVLAVGYFPPWPDFDWDAINKATKESVGYEIYGYWGFFSSEGADKIIEDNFEKFFNILFPENAKQWIEDFVPLGKLKTYLTSKPAAPPPSWIPAEERRIQSEALLKDGVAASLCWYRVQLTRISAEDDKGIPASRYSTDKPALFIAAAEDYIAIPSMAIPTTKEYCSNVVIKEFQANHWVHLQRPDEVNKELGVWLEGLNLV
uniref:AB hydrolase-1 domain-containing protein n=1 Tax=Moniliophthora roreri TaxID=221103 RepID=A0A0W0FKQ5_MONRR